MQHNGACATIGVTRIGRCGTQTGASLRVNRSSSIRDEGRWRWGRVRRPRGVAPISLARVYVLYSIPLVDNGSNGLNGEGNEVSRFQIRSFAPRVSGLIA